MKEDRAGRSWPYSFRTAFQVVNARPVSPHPWSSSHRLATWLLSFPLATTMLVGAWHGLLIDLRSPRYIECDCGVEVEGEENDGNEKKSVRASACLSIDSAIRMTYPVGFVSSWIKCRRKSGCNQRWGPTLYITQFFTKPSKISLHLFK